MAILHIHLQEGFEGDAVEIRAAGREAYSNPAARTRTQIGLAAMAEVTVPDGEVEVEIRLPGRSLARSVRVPVAGTAHLGISLEGDRIETRVEPSGFGYV